MMLSQPRVFLAMARDGLLPPSFFAAIHPTFQTPWKSTILTGLCVGTMGACAAPNPGRAGQHRHPLGFRDRLRRGAGHEADQPRCRAALPRPPLADHAGPGILICLLLMFSLPAENWVRLIVWLAIGLAIYFGYGKKHSLLAHPDAKPVWPSPTTRSDRDPSPVVLVGPAR